MFRGLALLKKAKHFIEAGMRKEKVMKILVIVALLLMTGCAGLGQPCEEKWTKTYNAKGQVMYVLDKSSCVSVTYKEPYTS